MHGACHDEDVPRLSRADQAIVTRTMVVAAARELFGRRGYANVRTEDVVRRAGLTRGALYHHFRDKRELFAAVVEEAERSLLEVVASATEAHEDPVDRVLASMHTALEAFGEAEFRQIALADAPAVLGWPALRRIDDRYALGHFKRTLADAMDAGALTRHAVEPVAHVLMGAVLEGSMLVMRSDQQEAMRGRVACIFSDLVDGLRAR